MQIALLDVVQNFNLLVEKALKSHVPRLALETKPLNNLITEASAFGDCLRIALQAFLEDLFSVLVPFVL